MTDDERFQLWCELEALANAILQVTEWWWHLDPALDACNRRRSKVDQGDAPLHCQRNSQTP